MSSVSVPRPDNPAGQGGPTLQGGGPAAGGEGEEEEAGGASW